MFLFGHGIAIRGHSESKGNLQQFQQMWSKENDILLWENRYTSHQKVYEVIEILGFTVQRKEGRGPGWSSIIADEATDVVYTKQLNLSIHWESDNFEVHDDPIVFCMVPDKRQKVCLQLSTTHWYCVNSRFMMELLISWAERQEWQP